MQLNVSTKDFTSNKSGIRKAQRDEKGSQAQRESSYSYTQASFTQTHLRWWMQYGITEEVLKRFNVVSIARFDGVKLG